MKYPLLSKAVPFCSNTESHNLHLVIMARLTALTINDRAFILKQLIKNQTTPAGRTRGFWGLYKWNDRLVPFLNMLSFT